jgi:hypothetical protein
MSLLLLSCAAGAGCLITDPVAPIDDSGNADPEFFIISPANSETVFLANTASPVVFRARARDDKTPEGQLEWEWRIDNGAVVLGPGLDLREYQTSGEALGAGIHVIGVIVTDDALPTGFATLEWQVQVQ